jgi:hypothetical protein
MPRSSDLPDPGPQAGGAPDPVLAHALAQLAWYERSRDRSRRVHRAVELGLLLTTSATLAASALSAPAPATAGLAAGSLFLTGLRQFLGSGERWASTGVAWMELRQAVVRYRLLPEEARDEAAREALLARVEEIELAEVRSWADHRRSLPGSEQAGAAG